MVSNTRTILIATDFSQPSVIAIDWAAKHLIQNGDRVVILNSVQDIPVVSMDPELAEVGIRRITTDTDATKAVLDEAHVYVKEWANHLRNHVREGISVDVETEVLVGAPGPSVVMRAKELAADMVVVGTHGRTGFSHLIIGSVSQYINNHCKNCPVVLVRTDAEHAASKGKTLPVLPPIPTPLAAPRQL
ncbi:hypothetical protein BC831DRAFT_473809 [Entophlyctis helioformis]|nr:hypothetical protein BC831DRAFT_473809 [Entophlyctis helioformis]